MTDDPKSLRLNVVMPPSQVAAIDDWRKRQDDLPSRSEAIRRLVNLALVEQDLLSPLP